MRRYPGWTVSSDGGLGVVMVFLWHYGVSVDTYRIVYVLTG